MKTAKTGRKRICKGTFILSGVILLGLLSPLRAEELTAKIPWKCIGLLDEETKSLLISQEKFFAGLFSLPQEYESALPQSKETFIRQWITDLRGSDSSKVTQATACLGMAKAAQAARPLEQLIASGKGGGRPRWVATRSLGQIGDKASIPVLINLLGNSNQETRVYARVSLAEITGVYFGEDKEKWKAWQPGNMPQYCTAEECLKGDANSISVSVTEKPSKESKTMLGFQLYDVHGRMVDSQDYAGVPVLIMFGSCWCGGCQQDAEPFRQLAEEYAGKRLLCIRTVAGDNELAALDFQNHYRLPMVQLLDTSRAFEKKYNPDGWTFLMLCDRQGKVVYQVNSPHEEDWKKLRAAIDSELEKPVERHAMMRDGTIYMPGTLKRSGESDADKACQRFSSIACAPDGKIYVVFTSVINETSDVLMRWFDGTTWSQDIPVAATAAQEYDATILADGQNRIWVCWTSNANNGHYDIFLTSFTSPSQIGPAAAVTQYEDDAMHGRMACDKDGGIWVTYYKWRKMGQYSRDKEVYLRRFANNTWSKEIQISPTDVPEYEDHSDPSISICGNWAVVSWSWDFHPPVKGYSVFAELPTIFIRAVNRDMTLGKISSVSSKNIDLMPAVGVSGNQRFWCAWDSQSGNNKKQVCIANPTMGTDVAPGKIQIVCDAVKNLCTPAFVSKPDGGLTLLWSQTADGKQWTLRMANLDNAKNQWSQPTTIETRGNPRFAGGAYDKQGQLWVAYSQLSEQGSKILVKKVDTAVEASEPNFISAPQTVSNTNNPNIQAVQTLRRLVDEKYSYRDLRGVNWDNMFSLYGPKMEQAETKEDFAESAAKMLSFAKDMHLWVKIGDQTIGGFKRNIQRNYRMDMLEKKVPNWTRHNDRISTGRFEGGIGYILIGDWDTKDKSTLEPAFEALKTFSDCRGIIVDIRPNGGGGEGLAAEFAGCFIDKPAVYSKHVYRDINVPDGWGKVKNHQLKLVAF